MRKLTIIFAAVLCAAVAAAQELGLGAEQRIAPVRRVPSYLDALPVAASDGNGFLVVARRGTDLIATRVSASGEVLDPEGILIPAAALALDVEFVNGRYVILTQSELITIRTDGRVGVRQPLLYGVQGEAASAGGALAFPTMFAGRAAVAMYVAAGEQFILQRIVDFGNAADFNTVFAVHPLANGFAAVQRPQCGSGFCIALQAFDLAGEFTGVRQQFPIGTASFASSASNGSRVLFTWLDAQAVKARAVDALSMSAETTIDTTAINPAVEPIGSDFAVRISNRSHVVRTNPDPVVVSTNTDRILDALAFNGRDVLYVVPQDVAGRITARIGWTGPEIGLFRADADRRNPAVAEGIGVTFVAWEERNARGTYDIRGALVRPGQPAVEMAIQPSGREAAVAFDGRHFIVAYRINNETAARRITVDGTLDPVVLPLAHGATGAPAIAAANGQAFAVWENGPFVQGARIVDGQIVDRPALVLDEAQPYEKFSVDVAWSGTDWVVAFTERDGATFITVAYVLRVAANGAVTMPRTEIGRGWDPGALTVVGSDRGALAAYIVRAERLTLFHRFTALHLRNDAPPRAIALPTLSEPILTLDGFRDGSGFVLLYSERRVIGSGTTGLRALRISDAGEAGAPRTIDFNLTPSPLRAFRHGIVYLTADADVVFRYFVPPPRRRAVL